MILRKRHSLLEALLCVFLLAPLAASAQKSDMELLREGGKHKAPKVHKEVPYGIVEGHTTISPLYHSASGVIWLWENYIYPEICTPGGFTDTNTAYFKELVKEYGSPMAIIYGLDRAVRNTKIGRVTTHSDNKGVVADDPKRYRQ